MPSLKELLNTESLKSGGSYLSDLADTIVNLPTNLQRVVTHPQIFNKIVGYNPMQKETGFAAAATGLPPKQEYAGGILNPPNLEYEKGYESGEPVAIAAGAAPFAIPIGRSAGKALAPKMYQMAEDYMVKTGGLIPITAWHGTPHNIQGKFDISKVGTGEGAQSYGHGMYFAENPAVAKQYQAALSNTKYKVGEKELKGNEAWAAQFLHDFQDDALPKRIDVNTAINKVNEILKDTPTKQEIINNIKSLDKAGLTVENGNLYKVDIPDEHIPNMLDWDKPLKDQQFALKAIRSQIDDADLLKSFDYNVEKGMSGANAYKNWVNLNWAGKGQRGYKTDKDASEALNALGVKGIRYEDAGSRGKGGTSNFVVFDPSTVEILEKNGQNVLKDMLVK